MTHDEMIEAVARAIWNCNFHPDDVASGEAERRISDWPEDWAKSVRHARAAIHVIAPAMEQETVAKIVAWLRIQDDPSEKWALQNSHWYADEIEAKFGGRDAD